MKVTLAYLVPLNHWDTYGPSAAKFSDTYREFAPGAEHELVVVCCNGPATDELRGLFSGIACAFDFYAGDGWDCGAAQSFASRTDADFLVCANAGVYFFRPGWLRRIVKARLADGDGLYGASASFESVPYAPGACNPHIRTSFYACNPRIFREFPFQIDSREKCIRFEAGDWNFMRWMESRGLPCRMVTWDGCYAPQEFRTPPNVFRKGDQSNMLVHDRHTDLYNRADANDRLALEIYANGGETPLESHREAIESSLRLLLTAPGNQRFAENHACLPQPMVSIGLPVYNGGNYLRQALAALLAQDYPHFELIVSDNGSRDDTESICREFAARDPRIRYFRQSENRGQPWNFAFVAREARHDYFMWAAHDDLWHPSYIRKCLAALQSYPEAVLCCSEITFIDAAGNRSIHYAGYQNIQTLGMIPAQRVHELISRSGWFALYALMRTEAVRKLSLGLSEYGCDVIYLMELLLQGDFAKVPEPLFCFRILIEGKTAEDYRRDFQSRAPASATPYAGVAARLLGVVFQSALSSREKEEIFADFILTLTCANPSWRRNITAEMLGPGAVLDDSKFAFLLGLILNRAMPPDQIQANPLSQAIYRAPLLVPDLLSVARAILQPREKGSSVATQDRFGKAARLFELGRLQQASSAFELALRNHETSDAWSDWATVQLALNRIAAAEQGFRRALQLDAANAQAAAKLGILLAKSGKPTESIPYLEQSLSRASGPERTAIEELLAQIRQAKPLNPAENSITR
jgi:tetratricopeptide (TPR) repeat protein